MQLKKHSLIEAITNIIVGYTVNIIANLVIFPLWGWTISVRQSIEIGVLYTIISLVRSYLLRRAFTHLTENSNSNSNSN
jgi:hypothetical protein